MASIWRTEEYRRKADEDSNTIKYIHHDDEPAVIDKKHLLISEAAAVIRDFLKHSKQKRK